jgi:periplasmic copper chaperone A
MMVLALAAAAIVAALPVSLGPLRIETPVLRVASPASKTGAGYMIITNRGKVPDRLLAVTTTAATRSDLHGSIQRGNVMQMRAQAGGVPIPAGGRVVFSSGGLHVMFIGLKAPVPVGTRVKAQLQFQLAGRVDVEFTAQGFGSP